MDILVVSALAPKLKEKFETQTSSDTKTAVKPTPKPSKEVSILIAVVQIISIAVGCFAAYLSWTCNTLTETNIVLKVIFAIFAFLFGFIYLIIYFIFRWGDCRYIREKMTPVQTQPQPIMNAGRRRR